LGNSCPRFHASTFLLVGLKVVAWYFLSPDLFRSEATDTRMVYCSDQTESGFQSFRSTTCMSDLIGAFLRAERGHQRAGNAASVTGSREDFHLQVDAQLGAQTKAPRQPGRSQIASSQTFRRRAWSAGPPGLCWSSRSGSPGASSPLGSRARARCAGAHSPGSHP
jgi:hypothetical protein